MDWDLDTLPGYFSGESVATGRCGISKNRFEFGYNKICFSLLTVFTINVFFISNIKNIFSERRGTHRVQYFHICLEREKRPCYQ